MDSNKCVMSTQGLGGRFGWLLDAPPAALADKLGFRSEFAGVHSAKAEQISTAKNAKDREGRKGIQVEAGALTCFSRIL